jgi:helix-hairpin-helix protein
MDPVAALRQIAYYKDRAREDPRRVMAYRNAADIVERLDNADTPRQRSCQGAATTIAASIRRTTC